MLIEKLQNEIPNFHSIFRIIIESVTRRLYGKFLLSLNCPIFGPCLDNIRLTFSENLMNGFDLFFYNLWSLYPYFLSTKSVQCSSQIFWSVQFTNVFVLLMFFHVSLQLRYSFFISSLKFSFTSKTLEPFPSKFTR